MTNTEHGSLHNNLLLHVDLAVTDRFQRGFLFCLKQYADDTIFYFSVIIRRFLVSVCVVWCMTAFNALWVLYSLQIND